jgi:hypothetical protein
VAKSPAVLKEVEVRLHSLPAELAGVRLAHVTDFHFSKWSPMFECARALLLESSYDLLMVTGDICHWPAKWRGAMELASRFLEPLAKRTPVFAVTGNHDHPDLPKSGDLPVTYLNNRFELVGLRDQRILVAGVEQYAADQGDLEEALGSPQEGCGCTILLAHYPSTIYRVPSGRVDLQLSGHTHGGQIRLPWFGCIWPNDAIPRSMARGLHFVDGTAIHVSAGLGASLPIRRRINCPAEVSILTLQPVESGKIAKGDRPKDDRVLASSASFD